MTKISYSTSVPCRLVRINAQGSHPRHGLLFEPEGSANKKTVVVHSHGTLGNFFFNDFLDKFAEIYTKNKISFLTFNHLAHDGLAESVVDGVVEYVGGSLSEFGTCITDFLLVEDMLDRMGFETIVFQGHSLGCERVVHYSEKSNSRMPKILLAPVNSRSTQIAWCKERLGVPYPDFLETLENSAGNTIRNDIYGSPSEDPEWDYSIPVTERALYSLLSSDAISYFDSKTSQLERFENTLVVLPSQDAFSEFSNTDLIEFFSSRLTGESESYVANCDHDFKNCLQDVCKKCVTWIESLKC